MSDNELSNYVDVNFIL